MRSPVGSLLPTQHIELFTIQVIHPATIKGHCRVYHSSFPCVTSLRCDPEINQDWLAGFKLGHYMNITSSRNYRGRVDTVLTHPA